MEIRGRGVRGREQGQGRAAGFTALLFYSDTAGRAAGAQHKKDATGTIERYYEMEISAHSLRPGENNAVPSQCADEEITVLG